MSLISNAKMDWHKLWSIRIALISALLGAVLTTYELLPADWQALFPNWLKLTCAIGCFIGPVSAAGARVWKQSNLSPPPPTTEPEDHP
jgi:hypothetical protein